VWVSWEISQLKKAALYSSVCIIFTISLSQLAGFWNFTKPIGEPLSVRLIQGNFEQSLKFNPKAIEEQFSFYSGAIESEFGIEVDVTDSIEITSFDAALAYLDAKQE
jgi:apolipoprotein N-acyltransferase